MIRRDMMKWDSMGRDIVKQVQPAFRRIMSRSTMSRIIMSRIIMSRLP
jgi:hypothetical protein